MDPKGLELLLYDCNKLARYAELMSDELGETYSLLSQLGHYTPYLSAEFVDALEAEISTQLSFMHQHTTLEEKEVVETRMETFLNWLD